MPAASDETILQRFAEAERAAERGSYRTYKAVLEQVCSGLAPSADRSLIWRSLADWPAFPDTAIALGTLQRTFKIAIVSNVDDDLWEATAGKLGVRPDVVVTAQQVRSYKPVRAHFEALCKRLGLPPQDIVHAGESLYHDIEPAGIMGFRTVWVRRVSLGPSASGPAVTGAQPMSIVGSIAQLADAAADLAAFRS